MFSCNFKNTSHVYLTIFLTPYYFCLSNVSTDDNGIELDCAFQLRAQLQSIESRYKAEIEDLNQLLAENRHKAQEMEKELRAEIASLKAIIKDLEARLGKCGFLTSQKWRKNRLLLLVGKNSLLVASFSSQYKRHRFLGHDW